MSRENCGKTKFSNWKRIREVADTQPLPLQCDSVLSRDEATRTPDPYVPNVVRYQLRYIPIAVKRVQRYIFFLNYVHFFGEKFADTQKKAYLCHT